MIGPALRLHTEYPMENGKAPSFQIEQINLHLIKNARGRPCAQYCPYSHLKNRMAMVTQTAARAAKIPIGSRIFSDGSPKVATFNTLIP